MIDLGTVRPGTTIYIPFATYDSNDPSASVTLTGLATTDIEVYSNGSVTQRASDSGYALLDTDGIDFDGITGIHGFSINLADNTTAGFWAAGNQYWVVVSSVTVDAATINFIAATFRIGYEDAVINTTIASLSSQTSFTLTAGPAEDDALNGCVVCIHDVASAVQLGFAVISDYTGSTKTVTLAAGTTFTAAATDNIAIFPRSNLSHIAGSAVSTSSAQIGVNVVNAGGTAWGSGAITAAAIASDAITAAKIAAGAIDAATFAADVDAEILSYLVDDATRIDASALNTASVTSIPAILVDTNALNDTKIPDTISLANINAQADTALTDYDPPTRAELTSDINSVIAYLDGLVIAKGTIGSTGNSTTALHLTGLTYGDDEINNYLLAIHDVSAGEWHARYIEDWADTGDLATVATLPFTPENAVDTYVILAFRQDVTGGAGLDAAGVRAAIGLASANLDTQLDALPTAAEIVNEWESQSQADPTGFHVNVLEIGGTAQTANDNGADINAILADTNELQTDWVNGGRLDLILDARASQTSVDDLPTNAELATALDALPTAAENADAVWDEDATAHQTGGTFGQAIGDPGADTTTIYQSVVTDAAGTNVAADIIDIEGKVDDLEGRLTATRAGYLDNLSAGAVALEATAQSILTDTAEIGAAGAGLTEAGGTGDQLTALATATELAKVPKSDGTATWNATALASIQSEANDALVAYDPPTKAELDSGLAGLNDLSAAEVNAEVDTALADYDGPTKTEMDTAFDAVPTAVENADALLGRNIAGGSSTGRTVKDALRFLRNKWGIAGGTLTVYQEDDTTEAWTADVTQTAGDPVSEVDPS